MNDDHHNPTSLHWTDRVLIKNGSSGEWWVYRLDDPHDEAVEMIPIGELCFHVFESGAA